MDKIKVGNDNIGDDPYQKGKLDFEKKVSRSDNPYFNEFYGTTFYEAWLEGWDDAKEASLKMDHEKNK